MISTLTPRSDRAPFIDRNSLDPGMTITQVFPASERSDFHPEFLPSRQTFINPVCIFVLTSDAGSRMPAPGLALLSGADLLLRIST